MLLRTLDINIWDAEDLFDILDVDDSGLAAPAPVDRGRWRGEGDCNGGFLAHAST